MSRVLYPGSFDPLHLGHVDVIEQAAELFGDVVVGVLGNPGKTSGLFELDERANLATSTIDASSTLRGRAAVDVFTGLVVDAARDAQVDFIVKGLRTADDFETEQQMAQTNYSVSGIRTVYVPCRPELGYISSRYVREIARYGRDVSHMVPDPVADALQRVFAPGEDSR